MHLTGRSLEQGNSCSIATGSRKNSVNSAYTPAPAYRREVSEGSAPAFFGLNYTQATKGFTTVRAMKRRWLILLSVVMLMLAPPLAADTTVRMIDLNIGAGVHGKGAGTCKWCASTDGTFCDLTNKWCVSTKDGKFCNLTNNLAIVGLRRLFGREAVAGLETADRVVIAMQEVDIDTRRNSGWDMPEYFRNRLERYTGQAWYKEFLQSRNFQDGQYGIALLANTRFFKQTEYRYAWSSSNKKDYGCEPQVALAGKIRVDDNNVLWVVNTHLAAKNNACLISDAAAVDAATRQVWQVLGMMGRMDPDQPILFTGDFNIRQGGDHKTDGTSSAHRDAYQAVATILGAAGFEQLGYVGDKSGQPMPCWNVDTCTFKSRNDYSKLDYLLLRDPHNRIQASEVTLLQPLVDPGCWLTDHKGLRVDLTFTD